MREGAGGPAITGNVGSKQAHVVRDDVGIDRTKIDKYDKHKDAARLALISRSLNADSRSCE